MSERIMLNDFVEMVGPPGSVERLLGLYRKEILELRESESQLRRRVKWLENIILQAASCQDLNIEFDINGFCYRKPLGEDRDSIGYIYGGVLAVNDTPEDFK